MSWILGTHRTDFARNLTREALGIDALVEEVVAGVLADAQLDATAVETIHVGNAFGQLYTGQGHLGAMPATVEPALWGVPAARHEAACASGSIAVLQAMAELEAGRYDVALVVGAEIERNVDGVTAAANMAPAIWVGHESTDARFVWPAQLSELAQAYEDRHGLDAAHLHAFAEQAYANAVDNPFAQTRSWTHETGSFSDDDVLNPVVEGRTRRKETSQVTDGAAAVVLVSDRWLAASGRRPPARIAGWGHRTTGLSLQSKLDRATRGVDSDPHLLPHVRDTFADALRRADVGSVDDLDAVEVHDCFAISGYMAIDHLGITAPGDAWKAIESGEIARDGRIPVNPGGGLIGGGHPVGATGVRMLVDATNQVSGGAGPVEVARRSDRVGTLNIGGSTTTTVSFIVEGSLVGREGA